MTDYGPRTRVRNDSEPDITSTWLRYAYGARALDNPNTTTEYTSVDDGALDTQVTIDVVDEHFLARRAAGEIFNNPFTSVKEVGGECQPEYYYHRDLAYWGSGLWQGRIDEGYRSIAQCKPSFLPMDPDDYAGMHESVKDKAVTMAYANRSIAEMSTNVSLVEGRKTIQSAYEILFRVAEVLLAAKRLDWRYLKDELSPRELSARYMELRYAIRPMVIDAENIVKATKTAYEESRKTARGYSEDRVVISDTTSTIFDDKNLSFERTSSYIVEARAGVLCDVSPTPIGVWGLDQIAEAGWEIIPFSFIAGWFLNFADLISAWTPKPGVRELASWVTVRSTLTQSVRLTDVSINTPMSVYNDAMWSGSCILNTVRTDRIPSPQLGVWPELNIKLDSLKIIDLGIIITGIMNGSVRKLWK